MSTIPKIGLGPTPHPRRLHVGDLTLTFLDGGELWLDGGAMFGIIPKPMWARGATVDEANRIPLAMTCTLVESGGKRILVETGAGAASKYSDKEQGFFRFGNYTIVDSLAAIGLEPDAIDIVILTHLHFDHAGGGTTLDGKGGHRTTFPRAKYIIQRGEWDDALSGHVVMTGTYRPENLAPLEAAGVLSFVSGEAEIAPGIAVRPMVGHTRHQQGVVFYAGAKNPLDDASARIPSCTHALQESFPAPTPTAKNQTWEGIPPEAGERKDSRTSGGGESHCAILPGDMIPTAAHLGLRHNMAYDLLPYENMVNKAGLLREIARTGATLLIGQDPGCPAWRVEESAGRFSAAQVSFAANSEWRIANSE